MPLFMITLAPIAFGVCLAYLYSEPRTFKRVYRVLGFRWSPFVWIACLIAAFYFAPADLAGFPRLAIQCSLALLLGSLVIREDHYAARFLQWPLLARIGAISYGLYLYHEWIIDYSGGWIDRLLQRLGVVQTAPMLRFAAITAICIAVAEVSFRFIESPILRVRARFQSTQ
jgi:peptidoglycan/LPS O-acetylase OafA/YrhL